MSPQAQLAMILWLPIILYIFSRYPSRTAIILSFVGGMLFLPRRAGFALPLIPDYSGAVATCYGILIATFIYDPARFNKFKWQWIDIPMICWCWSPMFSSLTNDLGAYDGLNTSIDSIATWGLPYLLGRLYLDDLLGLKELAIALIKGGIIYVPMCLYEIKFSPQIHLMVYGYYAHPSGIAQSIRGSTYRASVFLEHGLVAAMFLFVVTLTSIWLCQAKVNLVIWGQPLRTWSIILVLTLILMKSSGSYGYLLFGLIILFVAKWTKTNIPLMFLICLIMYYLYLGITGTFDGEGIIDWITKNYDADRAQSLGFRFKNEEVLRAKAQEKFLFGWGGWGRNRIMEYDNTGQLRDMSVTDSFWIIVFGINGAFGLMSWSISLLLPVTLFAAWRYPPKTWFNPNVAPAAALAVSLTLFVFDSLMNVTFSAIFPLICGGIAGLVMNEPESLTTKPTASKPQKAIAIKNPNKRAPFPRKRFPLPRSYP